MRVGHVKSLYEFKEQLGRFMDEESIKDCSVQRHRFLLRSSLGCKFLKVGVREVFTHQFVL